MFQYCIKFIYAVYAHFFSERGGGGVGGGGGHGGDLLSCL